MLPAIDYLPAGHERIEIGSGYRGTAETIDKMQLLVTEGKRNFDCRVIIGKLIQECPPKDYYCQAQKIFDFCQNKIKYAFDPSGVELVERPARILQSGIADCDSICTLFACMCESIGFPCRFTTIKADTGRPDDFSHVYAGVKIPKKGWINADCTMQFPFGWAPPAKYPKKQWPASKDREGYDTHDTDEMAGFNMNGIGMGFLGDMVPGAEIGTDPTWAETEFRDQRELDPFTRKQLEETTYQNQPAYPSPVAVNEYGATLLYAPNYGLPAPAVSLGYFGDMGATKLVRPGIGGVRMIQPKKILQMAYKGELKKDLMELLNRHEGELREVLVSSQRKIKLVTNPAIRTTLQKMWQPAWDANAKAVVAVRRAVGAYKGIVDAIRQNGGGNEPPPPFLAGLGEIDRKVLSEFMKIDPIEQALATFNTEYKEARQVGATSELVVEELHDRIYNADKARSTNKVVYAIAALAAITGAFAVYKTVDWKNLFSSRK